MAGDTGVSKKNPDGSVSVWIRGWVIRFPAEAGEPVKERDGDPPTKSKEVAGLRIGPVGDKVGVTFKGWVVLVPLGGDPQVVRTRTDRADTEVLRHVIREQL
jgi:hypothetical protein